MKNITLVLILNLIIFSCSSETNRPDLKELNNNANEVTNKQEKQQTIDIVLPYESPKSIEEIYNAKLIVDTIYSEVVPNGVGDDDNEHFVKFNQIIGKSESKEYVPNQMISMKGADYFKTLFEHENDELIIPFYIDEERENTILTIWEREINSIEYKSYVKNLFLTKYSMIRVIDKVSIEKTSYLLGETYSPDEGSLNRKIWVTKLNDENELKFLKNYNLGEIDIDSTITECGLKKSKNMLLVLNNNNIIDEIEL